MRQNKDISRKICDPRNSANAGEKAGEGLAAATLFGEPTWAFTHESNLIQSYYNDQIFKKRQVTCVLKVSRKTNMQLPGKKEKKENENQWLHTLPDIETYHQAP